jgi:hypothetical protein
MEFERVFYKNDFASGAALLNIYMICESDTTVLLIKRCAESYKMEGQTGVILDTQVAIVMALGRQAVKGS